MKSKWFWPLLLSLLIVLIVAGTGIYMAVKSNEAENTLYVDNYIKNQTLKIEGKVAQQQSAYYLKPGKKEAVKLHVKEGEVVQAGNPLFTYGENDKEDDQTELSLQLDNKRVEKEQIEGQIAAYKERLATAAPEESTTLQAQINWLESEQTKAENNISILEQQQKEIDNHIGEQTIKAGASGTILDIDNNQLQAFTANRQDKPVVTMGIDQPYFEGFAGRNQVELLAPMLQFKTESDQPVKGELTKVALTPQNELLTKEKAEDNFLIEGQLDKTVGLYLGDKMTIIIHPSQKDHVWLPKKYVKKETKNNKTKYVVKKVYGSDKKDETVTVEREAAQYYLVTKGLSAIDKLHAFEK
ncbi:efflux RND transporter periplasmic adaptor subunit [Macrococcus hajekii]|uniref:Efflux RND transporter periplasmic adaptor subunit n=1 Tax=Macrococcus hajekii TaxID=198482 RepID=A0A4R6BJ03_9STAP|nr:efflux RND transporter periplasmic adaptor subunit [Macrococcus hajekii]TDM01673.1 efflux RND transporter periplasmic adaptor subunit [Macrococcus hajekii]GGB13272.1 hypothetical protein GCM10007190_21720 [Macrococcus hajekii]